ncbi:proline-rich protein 4 [Quercus suber]|uniref:Proline-rich protein 4 n=1 Tax=Quercus suber TaxID=58331 RepID=A0AAW0KNV2_QUESU|nr:proline-rich protein 4 [Quercus suber]
MSMAGGSVGRNSFIAFARKKGAIEELNLSPFIYLNVGLVSGFSCMFNFEDWLRVTIDCKPENGHFKTRGVGKLDEEGKFKVSVHRKIVKDGKLNEECYAQLHSASAAPCPAHNGLESSKVVFKSKTKCIVKQ